MTKLTYGMLKWVVSKVEDPDDKFSLNLVGFGQGIYGIGNLDTGEELNEGDGKFIWGCVVNVIWGGEGVYVCLNGTGEGVYVCLKGIGEGVCGGGFPHPFG